jgi:hypothetical protein
MSFRCLPPLGSPSALTGGSRSRSSPAGGRGCSSVTTAPWCAPAVATTSPRLSPPSWPSTLPVCELCSTASLSPAPGPSPASTGSARRRPQRLLRAGHVRRLRPAVGGRAAAQRSAARRATPDARAARSAPGVYCRVGSDEVDALWGEQREGGPPTRRTPSDWVAVARFHGQRCSMAQLICCRRVVGRGQRLAGRASRPRVSRAM